MALVDRAVQRGVLTGLAIGAVTLLVAPALLPAAARMMKPMARAAIRTGILTYERGREALAEMGELVEDAFAEAQHELSQGAESPKPSSGTAGASQTASADAGDEKAERNPAA